MVERLCSKESAGKVPLRLICSFIETQLNGHQDQLSHLIKLSRNWKNSPSSLYPWVEIIPVL